MKKILFIINPLAGVDRIKSLRQHLTENLDQNSFEYSIHYTEYAKHGTAIARKAAKNGIDIVVAVGGDGSVNDVINGIYGTETIFGIIPKGSGNGLARSLEIPVDEVKAIQRLNRLNIQTIDLGEADGNLFASNAGVGFDTVVTQKFRSSKKRGLIAYLKIILSSIWSYKIKDWEVEIDGQKPFLTRSFMLTAANAKQLGYGFKIAPEADLSDGYFHFVNVRKFPIPMAASIAFRAFMGTTQKSHYVKTQLAREIRISHPKLHTLQLDGEAIPCKNSIQIKILPNRLKVLV